MGIFEEKERQKEINESQERACEVYDGQFKAISSIINTDGFMELKAYFEREREATKDSFANCKKEDLEKLQEKFKLTNGFILFLENFEKKFNKA